jgi:hypothetical protein
MGVCCAQSFGVTPRESCEILSYRVRESSTYSRLHGSVPPTASKRIRTFATGIQPSLAVQGLPEVKI